MTLECGGCGEEKSLDQFWVVAKGKRGPDGKKYSHCRTCTGSRITATQAKKREWLAQYKLERGCADCGYSAHPAALDFDHLPGTEKSFSLKDGIATVGWKRLREEAEKCEVVCANCHRIRTVTRMVQAREEVV